MDTSESNEELIELLDGSKVEDVFEAVEILKKSLENVSTSISIMTIAMDSIKDKSKVFLRKMPEKQISQLIDFEEG